MRLVVIAFVGMLLGCQSAVISLPNFTPPPAHLDYIEEMKAIARNRHMYYKIICLPWETDPAKQFAAYISERESHGDLGTMTWQWGIGATQAEAARDLVLRLGREGLIPPEPPEKRVKRSDWTHKQCPPEIRGGPNEAATEQESLRAGTRNTLATLDEKRK